MATAAASDEVRAAPPGDSGSPDFSGVMARLLMAWIVVVAALSFITVPWLSATNGGDFTNSQVWFYHALMLPAALLFLIAASNVFTLHSWVRYLVSHSALIAIFEGAGFLILGYGTQHNVASLVDFGYWVIMPATLELFAVTVLFVIDLAWSALIPPRGARMSPQKAEITWVFFFTGVSVLTWVVFGLVAAASQVGMSWDFWARAQSESQSALMGNVITAHSHGMLPSFMAAIVLLAAEAFGYSRLAGIRKQVARTGAGIMLAGIALYSGIYTVSALGTFAIPAWFPSGPGGVNGLAMDDTMTGLVGVGALILAGAMVPELQGFFGRAAGGATRRVRRVNPVRIGVYLTYVMACAAMFFYGYYIEMNEVAFGAGSTMSASRVFDDQIFTRAHLLFVFGALPVIAVFLLATELMGAGTAVAARIKRWMSSAVVTGMVVTLVGMGIWVFSTPGHESSWGPGSGGEVLFVIGQCLMLVGAIVALFVPRLTGTAAVAAPVQPAPQERPRQGAVPARDGTPAGPRLAG